MKILPPILISFFLLVFCSVSAQETSTIDVNKDISITKVYEQVIKEGYGTPKVYLDLANAHYFEANYLSAKKWYEKVFETKELVTKKVLYRYKQSLKALNEDCLNNKYLVTLSTN